MDEWTQRKNEYPCRDMTKTLGAYRRCMKLSDSGGLGWSLWDSLVDTLAGGWRSRQELAKRDREGTTEHFEWDRYDR